MKLSTLNKFKGKQVYVSYRDFEGEVQEVKGLLEDVDTNEITVEYDTGITNISIAAIISIDLVDAIEKIR